MLKSNQTQRIYGMAAALGMVVSGSHDDALHDLVANIAGKDSVRALDDAEYKAVVAELAQRIKINQLDEPPAKAKRTKRYISIHASVREATVITIRSIAHIICFGKWE